MLNCSELRIYMDAPACQAQFLLTLTGRECSYTSGLFAGLKSLALMECADRHLINGPDYDVPMRSQVEPILV